MSCTRMGRIRKLIKKINAHCRTNEMHKPNSPRTMDHTTSTRNRETNEIVKTKIQITIFDNTFGRTERRAEQKRILEKISKEGFRPKKKLAVKKVKTTEPGTGKRKKK